MGIPYLIERCVDCGAPVTIAIDGPLLCAKCLLDRIRDEPQADRLREEVAEQVRLVADLGVPTDGFPGMVRYELEEPFRGYSLEMFGLQVSALPAPCPIPHYRATIKGVAETVLVLYLRRVRCTDLAAYV